MKWIIDKSFSFCYGHRVHNQRLDTTFTESGDACLACRHLHGHEGLVKVFLEEEGPENSNIEGTGMVTDFKHLGWFKNFLDDTLDHKFIMDIKDPLFYNEFPFCGFNSSKDDGMEEDLLFKNTGYLNKDLVHEMPEGYFIPDLTHIRKVSTMEDLSQGESEAIFEKYEGAIFVDFVPTSENLSAWLLKVVIEKMKALPNVRVKAIEYWETPKSHCRVEA